MSSEDENEKPANLELTRDDVSKLSRADRMQVSAWEDDDEDVEESRNAEGKF